MAPPHKADIDISTSPGEELKVGVKDAFAAFVNPVFEEFPKQIEGPTAWEGQYMQANQDIWTYHLTDSDIKEIEAAIVYFRSLDLPLAEITFYRFPLPHLGKKLEEIRSDIQEGRGFTLIRGLPVQRYTREESAAAFMGISSYFGPFVSQNSFGHLLGHVKDHGNNPDAPGVRLYTTNRRHWFHTDSSDIVALLCLQTSESGGASALAASHTVYNKLMKKNPEYVKELSRSDWYWDRKGEVPAGKLPFYLSPIFHYFKGRLLTIFDRSYLTTTKRHAGVPPLTDVRLEAIEAIEEVCQEQAVRMYLQPGDIQYVHNHHILHSREGYVDSDSDPTKRRHLYRLWMSTGSRGGWALPATFGERFAGDLSGVSKRGGIIPGVKECVLLDSVDRYV
ncbi:uncharacterized protein VTP21DRAFT_7873 [Calcarisporiella thermophila]|uniref:uncharacterized protein n=1 Tax=Calcarisporiella thermophila TaxID=911321 RepID=UPI003744826B